MYLPIHRNRDPFFSLDPFRHYNELRREMDELLAPAMHVLHQLAQPRVITPIHGDDTVFSVKTDVQQFAPEELKVKMTDDFLVIEGKHEEREDEHGFISRHFVRKYSIPRDVKHEELTCNLSSDGVLMISAPRKIEPLKQAEKILPINFTGQPAITTEKGREKAIGTGFGQKAGDIAGAPEKEPTAA